MSGRGRPGNCLAKIRQKILIECNGKILGMVRMRYQAWNFVAFVFFYFVIFSLDFSDAVNGKLWNLVDLQNAKPLFQATASLLTVQWILTLQPRHRQVGKALMNLENYLVASSSSSLSAGPTIIITTIIITTIIITIIIIIITRILGTFCSRIRQKCAKLTFWAGCAGEVFKRKSCSKGQFFLNAPSCSGWRLNGKGGLELLSRTSPPFKRSFFNLRFPRSFLVQRLQQLLHRLLAPSGHLVNWL